MNPDFGYGHRFNRYFESYDEFFPKSLQYLETALSDSHVTWPMVKAFGLCLTKGYDKHSKLKLDTIANYLDRTESPLFAMANLFTPHLPYDPPRPYKSNAPPELDRPRCQFLKQLGLDQEMNQPRV